MKKETFKNRYGPWALVTGGASGIGAEFGRQLASIGLHLILVDIQDKMLKDHAALLRELYGVSVITVTADLSSPHFMKDLQAYIEKRDVGLLVNNAGFGTVGRFLETDAAEMLKTLTVNCAAPLALTHALGKKMAGRKKGGIIFISSTSAFHGTPLVANYAATKAYNLILGESLWHELREHHVDVLAVAPAATNTPGFHQAGSQIQNVKGMPFMEPEQVVTEAIIALGNTPTLIAGKINRMIYFLMGRLLGRKKIIAMVGKNTGMLYPGS